MPADSRVALHAPHDAQPQTAPLGMWVFIASEMLFFGGLLVAYGHVRARSPAGFAAASAHTSMWLGTVNTALLLTSSGAIAIAAEAARFARAREARRGLAWAAALGLVFLAIKGVEYHREWSEGLFPGPGFRIDGRVVPGGELFFVWYFFATALHALHLLIGIVASAVLARRGAGSGDARRVQALALYWHFVDIVWIVLYPLIYLVGPRS